MSIKNTQVALIKKLNLLLPLLPTAYEATSFTPPLTAYQRVQIVPRTIKDTVVGVGYIQQDVDFQIFVNCPVNLGTGAALDRAELLRRHFKRGTTLTELGTVVHVLKTPQIAGAIVVGDRVIVPVIVTVLAEFLCD